MYQLSQGGQRVIGGAEPQLPLHRCLCTGSARIVVTLKGCSKVSQSYLELALVVLANRQMLLLPPGIREKCVDSLVFETMIPKPMMLHYISLLLKHKRLVLSGPSGTGKTYLAHHLARYLLDRSRTDSVEVEHESCVLGRGAAVTFNMHHQSQKASASSWSYLIFCRGPFKG